tara:strand:+ start:352 stop:567 length:216 start_codon:yes stop_codon:yes gene_type:complete
MDIKLWYSKDLKRWRWSLIDPVTRRQESGQQFDLREAMGDVANTVEYLIKDGYDGELEDNGRRVARGRTVD